MKTRNESTAPPFWVHGNPERKRIWYINQARKANQRTCDDREDDDDD